jgi:hypothetical protein
VAGEPAAGLAELRRGRTKRDLILGMLARTPGPEATEALIGALEAYPLIHLLLANEHPTRIWLVNPGEKLSSAEILTPEMRHRRWHSRGIGIDECDGVVDAAPGYVAMVSTWRTSLVLRHEFAHVITTFFDSADRATLSQLYSRAFRAGRFTEPLARESIGEFVACAISASFFPDLARRLATIDAALYHFVWRLRARAEAASAALDAAGAGTLVPTREAGLY